MKSYICLVLIILNLSSCSYVDYQPDSDSGTPIALNSDPNANETDKILLGFSADVSDKQTFDPIIEKFNSQNPDIQVQFVEANYNLSRGDQLSIADTSAVIYLSEPDYQSGYLHDLKSFIEGDASFNKNDYYTGLFERVSSSNGLIYGVPYLAQIPMLHYNKNIITNKGIEISDDWTWGEFISILQDNFDNTKSDREIYGILDENIGANTLLAALNASGSDIIYKGNKSGEVKRLDTVDVEHAVNDVLLLSNKKSFYTREQAESDNVTTENLIKDNRVAMWPSYMFSYEHNTGENAINMGTLTYPDSAIPNITPGWDFVMSAGTRYPLQAWRWLSFLSKHYLDGLSVPINDIGWSPARRSVREILVKNSTLNENDLRLQTKFLERASNNDVKVWNAESMAFIRQAMNGVIEQKLTLQDALREAQAEFEVAYIDSQKVPTLTPNPAVIVPTLQPIVEHQQNTTVVNFSAVSNVDQKRLIRNFNKENKDIFINLVDLSSKQVSSFSSIAQNVDCFSWDFIPKEEDVSSLLDLYPLMNADSSFNTEDYLQGLLQLYNLDGKYFGLPESFIPQKVLYYNKNIFDKLGLEYPSKDWSVDKFIQHAVDIGSINSKKDYYGFASPALMTSDLDSLLFKLQAKLYTVNDKKIEVDFTSTRNKTAIEKYIDLIKQASPHTHIQNYKSDDNQVQPVAPLTEGQVGMWFDSLGEFKTYLQSNPNIGVTLAPYGWSAIGIDDYIMPGFYISAGTTKPEACWKLIKYLQDSGGVTPGTLPARKSLANTDLVKQQNPDTLVQEYLALLDLPLIVEKREEVDYYWLYTAIDRVLQGRNETQELAEAERLTNNYMSCVQMGEVPSLCAKSADPTYKGDALSRP